MRLPLWPTLVVGLAVAVMVALGFWQIRRAGEKEALIARYAANAHLPPTAFPAVPSSDGSLLFRRASATCLEPLGWTTRGGRNRAGDTGWRHIVACRTGAEGPGLHADMGWSKDIVVPKGFAGGRISGTIDADRDHVLLLVSDEAAPGLTPSAVPSPADIPNNHRAYAAQWFLFAGVAVVIYLLALRRRARPSA